MLDDALSRVLQARLDHLRAKAAADEQRRLHRLALEAEAAGRSSWPADHAALAAAELAESAAAAALGLAEADAAALAVVLVRACRAADPTFDRWLAGSAVDGLRDEVARLRERTAVLEEALAAAEERVGSLEWAVSGVELRIEEGSRVA